MEHIGPVKLNCVDKRALSTVSRGKPYYKIEFHFRLDIEDDSNKKYAPFFKTALKKNEYNFLNYREGLSKYDIVSSFSKNKKDVQRKLGYYICDFMFMMKGSENEPYFEFQSVVLSKTLLDANKVWKILKSHLEFTSELSFDNRLVKFDLKFYKAELVNSNHKISKPYNFNDFDFKKSA